MKHMCDNKGASQSAEDEKARVIITVLLLKLLYVFANTVPFICNFNHIFQVVVFEWRKVFFFFFFSFFFNIYTDTPITEDH